MPTVEPAITPEQFAALSPAEQRVAVARDVIAQLNAERYIAERGVYVETGYMADKGVELRDQLLAVDPKCHVCAQGAVFLSHVRLGNRYRSYTPYLGPQATNALERAENQFSIWGGGTADELEGLFESFGGWYLPEGWKDLTDDERLRALMENIIRNDGELVAAELDNVKAAT